VAVVLSGMGIDGLAGAQRIVASGGIVAAQDRATSAVWGMPGAIVGIGIARLVGSPTRLGGRVRMLAEPQRRVSV
jgi:two-component system chemotaxis response regulator CheB